MAPTHTEGARAYAGFRAYSDVGGERMALAEPGSSWGTTDPDIAGVLFESKLERLRGKKKGRAVVPSHTPTTLAKLVKHHLVMKAKADISEKHREELGERLRPCGRPDRRAVRATSCPLDPPSVGSIRSRNADIARLVPEGRRER